MQKKIPNLFKALRADNVEKLKIIIDANIDLSNYARELPLIFDDSPKISAFIAYFGAFECFNYIVEQTNIEHDERMKRRLQGLGEDPNAKKKMKLSIIHADRSSRSTIHFAAAGGKSKFIRHLVEDFNQLLDIDSYHRNALHYAAEYNQKKAFDLITSYNKLSVDSKDIFGNTALHLATDNMCTPIVKSLVDDHGCNVNLRDKDGASSLMFAARAGSIDLFNFLIEKNANYKLKSKSDMTLLHYAAVGNDSDIIDILVKDLKFTSIDALDKYKNTPLFYACEKGAFYTSQSLICDYHANIIASDIDGMTPIHAACKSGNIRIFNMFFQNGAVKKNFLLVDNFGRTILHHAAEAGSMNSIKFFLDYTEEDSGKFAFRDQLLTAVTFSGYNALHSAAERNHPDVIAALVTDYGVDVNKVNNIGGSPLHCAAKANALEATIELIRLGADVNLKDNENMTPLDLAYQNNYTNIIQVLNQKKAQHSEIYSRNSSAANSPAINRKKAAPSNQESLDPL